jgi:hypothetical protein
MGVYVNGVQIGVLDYSRNTPAGATYAWVGGSGDFACVTGDVIDVRVRQESGADRVLYNNATTNRIAIEWVG